MACQDHLMLIGPLEVLVPLCNMVQNRRTVTSAHFRDSCDT